MTILAACDHSAAFSYTAERNGPRDSFAKTRLTYNVGQDDLPIWTADGRGILYAFSDPDDSIHSCVGILPPLGGTRLWQSCDTREIEQDSVTEYPAFALGSEGLLYFEVEAGVHNRTVAISPPLAQGNLWLSDTASESGEPHSDARRRLLALPQQVPGWLVTWLMNMQWTDATHFIVMGAQAFDPHIIVPIVVLRGTISAAGATLAVVEGSDSATSYGIVDGGKTVLFTVGGKLYQNRGAGREEIVPIPAAVVSGVVCGGNQCGIRVGLQLRRIDLATGVTSVVLDDLTGLFGDMWRSPVSGDIVATSLGDIFMLRNAIP